MLVATPVAAHAAEKSDPPVRSARIASADFLNVSHSADTAAVAVAGARSAARASKESTRVNDFLDRRARSGKLLKKSDVRVATVENPLTAGQDITLVWEGSKAPGNMALQAVGDEKNGAMGLGIEFVPDGTEKLDDKQAGLAGGSGYGPAADPKNMYRYRNGCANAYWDSSYSSDDYHVENCWEKWAQSGTNHWVYNRWGLFTRPNSSTANPDIRDFTIRSRPWKVDLNHPSSYVSKLNSWQPPGPSNTCVTSTYNVGGGAGGVSASVGIPIQTCNTTILHVDTGQKMLGIGVEGHEPTGRQVRLDIGGDFNATNSTAVPVWADYAWATVRYISGPQTVTDTDDYVLKDSGW
jgi:hypothetical protein